MSCIVQRCWPISTLKETTMKKDRKLSIKKNQVIELTKETLVKVVGGSAGSSACIVYK